MKLSLRGICMFALMLCALPVALAQQESASDPLVRVLVTKGVLTSEEARGITAAATPAEQRDRLAALLRDKGVISAAEFEAIHPSSAPDTQPVKTMTANYKEAAPAKPPSAVA